MNTRAELIEESEGDEATVEALEAARRAQALEPSRTDILALIDDIESHLDREVGAKLGFEPSDDPEAVINRWRERFPGERVGVMASGTVFPRA